MYNETLYDLFAAKTSKLRGKQEDGTPDTPLSVKGMKFRMEQTDEVPNPPLIINEDSRGIHIKGLESKLVESEKEALNMLFEVCKSMTEFIVIILLTSLFHDFVYNQRRIWNFIHPSVHLGRTDDR